MSKERLEKLENENKFLREQHKRDLEVIEGQTKAAINSLAEIQAATDILIAQIIDAHGVAVEEDGEVIGKRLEIPQPKPIASRVMVERYSKVVGLDEMPMYRLGIVFGDE